MGISLAEEAGTLGQMVINPVAWDTRAPRMAVPERGVLQQDRKRVARYRRNAMCVCVCASRLHPVESKMRESGGDRSQTYRICRRKKENLSRVAFSRDLERRRDVAMVMSLLALRPLKRYLCRRYSNTTQKRLQETLINFALVFQSGCVNRARCIRFLRDLEGRDLEGGEREREQAFAVRFRSAVETLEMLLFDILPGVD